MTIKSEHDLMEVYGVKKSFHKRDLQELIVLNDVNLSLKYGEIIALLGKSGSGKSTLLRIMAGLIKPNAGEVFFKSFPVRGPVEGLSMVFQNFALLPWLTVLQNVELGLEAKGMSAQERRSKALDAIDVIGLDGFESAYPKELSGGMRQRVGFARAMVVEPDILLMDEPFSALDVLTAENLRGDLIDLWEAKKTNIKAIVLVTHNIEEAALLSDRILIFGSNPGYIRTEIPVDMPHPRNDQDPKFRQIVDDVYNVMTTPEGKISLPGMKFRTIGLGYRLPKVEISEITGFMEEICSPEYHDKVSMQVVSDELSLDVDDIFPIMECLEILRFASVKGGEVEPTESGKQFAHADILERKKIFASHLMSYVPLARHIRRELDEAFENTGSEERFLHELQDYLSEEASEEVLKVVIDWGRYAEIFAYDYNSGILSLENPE